MHADIRNASEAQGEMLWFLREVLRSSVPLSVLLRRAVQTDACSSSLFTEASAAALSASLSSVCSPKCRLCMAK
jgi:hypothetical protein